MELSSIIVRRRIQRVEVVSPTLIPGKVMKQLILDTISKLINHKKVAGSCQHGFMKGKSCLAKESLPQGGE